MFRHILVPLDGSRLAEAALERALAFVSSGTKLTLVRVTPEPVHPNLRPHSDAVRAGYQRPLDIGDVRAANVFAGSSANTGDARIQSEVAAATTYLEGVADRLRARDVRARVMTVPAPIASVGIVQTAASERCDLIAMASHGRGGLKRLLIGSTVDAVVRASTVPVLVVRGGVSAGADAPIRRVLVTLDGSTLSERALGMLPVVASAKTRVELMRVVPVPDSALLLDQARMPLTRMADVHEPLDGAPVARHFDRDMDAARAYLDAIALPLRRAFDDVQVVTAAGDETSNILEIASADQIDLIVMATHGRGGLKRAILGSVTDAVLRRARCAVLVTPAGETAE